MKKYLEEGIMKKDATTTLPNGTTIKVERELLIRGGAFDSLEKSARRLGFKTPKDLAWFLISITDKMATSKITIIDITGENVSFNPANHLLNAYEN